MSGFPIGSAGIGQWWLPFDFESPAVAGNYNYARIAATAARLITKFGQAWTLTTTIGPADSSSRTYPGVQIDTVTGLSGDGGNGAYFGDSGVQIGDVVLLLHPSANPVQGDRIQDASGTSYVLIVKPNPVKPAGTVLMWQVWGRQG